nr:hypothetical protein [uncultured archaeon]AQS32092.1 hypothetical protein [uncultured archaeon]
MSSASDHYLSKIERERKIKIPLCIFKNESMKELDSLIRHRNATQLSSFYKDFKSKINFDVFNSINERLKDVLNVCEDDAKLINKLTELDYDDPNTFFDFIGNLYYIAGLIAELEENPEMSSTIKVTIRLWVHLNIIELLSKHVSELLLKQIKGDKKEFEFKQFINKFEDGKHPELGSMIETLVALEYLKKNSNSILEKDRIIRNRISHANIFYDKDKNSIYLSNGEEYSPDEFKNDFASLYSFLQNYIRIYNDKKGDFFKNLDELFDKISHFFLAIERAGPLKKVFNEIVFEWEK